MINEPMQCPRCQRSMTLGFASSAATIPRLTPQQVIAFIHADQDVHAPPLWKKFLPHVAAYFVSHLCEGCGVYVIEFHRSLSSDEAKAMARAALDATPAL